MFNVGCVHSEWKSVLDPMVSEQPWHALETFVAAERLVHMVYPREEDIFRALAYSAPEELKVVIVGQDPYHDQGQAHGLSFSVPSDIARPPSLRNILLELQSDIPSTVCKSSDLTSWARQGVMLLNSVLTVRAHEPGSHRNRGWEVITDRLLLEASHRADRAVFFLWGNFARQKRNLIDTRRHLVLESVHPSPLSAHRGFFGSKPFSRANDFLVSSHRDPVDWSLINE